MEPYRRRLQLDRQELLLLFCVFFLISGLMFTLGLMIGYGVRAKGSAPAHAEASAGEHHEAREPAGAHEGADDPAASDGHGGHAPKKAAKAEADPSKKLVQALDADKQKALNESALNDNGPDEPKSVQDVKAHFAANPAPPPARAPASEPEKTKTVEKEKKVAPDRVKGLFERRPASVEKYAPASGSFTVQIASFASEDESSAKVRVLRQSGFNESYTQAIKLTNGEVWYRVAIGSFPSPVWAKKTGEKLVRRGLASDFVIRKIP